MSLQTTQSFAKELSNFRASGLSTSAALESTLTLYSLQGKEITLGEMDELIAMAKHEPTLELFEGILHHNLSLNYMQISAIHAVAPDILKGHYYLALKAVANLKESNEPLITNFAPFSTIGTTEEVYDYLTNEVSKPENLLLLELLNEGDAKGKVRTRASTIGFLRAHLMQHLSSLTERQIKALYPALEFQFYNKKEHFRYNYKVSFTDLLKLRTPLLAGLLPKAFVALCFKDYMLQLTLRRTDGVTKEQDAALNTLMKEALELYEIIPKNPANWKEAPVWFLGFYADYIVQNNSVETSKALLSHLTQEAPCIHLLEVALPNEVIKDLCNAVELTMHGDQALSISPRIKEVAHKAFAVPILYTALKEEYRKTFIDELVAAPIKFLAHPYSTQFFTDLAYCPPKDTIYSESWIAWEENIHFIWETERGQHNYYYNCVKASGNPTLLAHLTENSFRLEHLQSLNIPPTLKHLTTAIIKDEVNATLNLLPLLPQIKATDFVHLIYFYNAVRLVLYLETYAGPELRLNDISSLVKKMEGAEVK